MILKDSLFRIHKNFKTIKNVMIISTLVNDIRSEDHVCLSPLSIKTSRWRIVAAPFAFSVQKFLKKNIFRTAFCAVKFLTFFETTSFYIFCTLTGDNDHDHLHSRKRYTFRRSCLFIASQCSKNTNSGVSKTVKNAC